MTGSLPPGAPELPIPQPPMVVRIEAIAQACHEVNRVIQAELGEEPSPHWDDAPQWQRNSAVEGVTHALGGATPEQLHTEWCRAKERDGWTWGPVKDADARTHPCLVSYEELPLAQKVKDHLFGATVLAMAQAFGLVI